MVLEVSLMWYLCGVSSLYLLSSVVLCGVNSLYLLCGCSVVFSLQVSSCDFKLSFTQPRRKEYNYTVLFFCCLLVRCYLLSSVVVVNACLF